jgi:hypothetical protein
MPKTPQELEATKNCIVNILHSPAMAPYVKELRGIKDAIASGAHNAKDANDAFKTIGILHGIDIALNLSDYIQKGK